VAGMNLGLTGPGYGVLGQNRSTSDDASAIRGEALGTSGRTVGVAGIAQASPLGTGVYGSSSTGFGMHAVSSGDGVNGSALWAEARSGKTGVAIYATNNNAGPTLVLNNAGSGDLMQAFNGGFLNFRVLNSGNVVFRETLGQKLNFFGSAYGIGIQDNTMYYRINEDGTDLGGFAWYKGGTHNDDTLDAGGGTRLMTLGRDGSLSAGRFHANANSNRTSLFLSQAGTGPLILAYGPGDNIPKVTVENTGDALFRGAVTANGFNNSSDRNLKKNISSVNAQAILEKVVALPISRWSYKSDAANTAHIGPMAQDFHAAFGLNGADDKHINTIDEGGVALAAIQGLYELNRQLKNENKALQERLAALEKELSSLKRLAALEAR
ncbi:MAG TPA: tail fiber domain-containing protein, partial [Meiothermus sp.]|nr:tail fiber domain-containing protein [Meiothermus sp.]